MQKFEQIQSGIYFLKIPFSGLWTGITLVTGEENCLIDSGAVPGDVDQYILPALQELGMGLPDIKWLLNTHSHGDHIGGHARLKLLGAPLVAAHEFSAPRVEDPVPYAIETRTRFLQYSPKPQYDLQGVVVDKVLKDGEFITERLQVIFTPGHDADCVCWYDRETKTIIAGDALQGNGTKTQGIAFYKNLEAYLHSLGKLQKMDIENIICGHDYDGIGWNIRGKEQVRQCLQKCRDYTRLYREFVCSQYAAGERDPVKIAVELINECGCGMPDELFLALYTVTQHLKNCH